MKTIVAGLLLAFALNAHALEIAPYTPSALAQAQKAGQAVTVHFHADWCPVCKAQDKVLRQWQGDASVPGVLLVADFDTEKALKQQLRVRNQSTLVFYKGTVEQRRITGMTDPEELRRAFLAVH